MGVTYQPKLFIGSSSEGLSIARVAKELLGTRTLPTLWEDDIFLPGKFALEVLEEELTHHVFALLVATADDLLVKRQEVVTTLRDNVLFECGLFMGALGRRRTFLLVPADTHVELPTDLRGLAIQKYSWTEATPHASLQPAIDRIILSIEAEWKRMQHAAREFTQKQSMGEQHRAIVSLQTASNRLLDVVFGLPRKVISGVHDRDAFDKVKQEASAHLRQTLDLWLEDAKCIGLERQFRSLVGALESALESIPFYQDLEVVEAPSVLVSDLPWLGRLLGRSRPKLSREAAEFVARIGLKDQREIRLLRGPLTPEERTVEQQAERVLRLVAAGLDNWWNERGPAVIREINAFQRRLVELLQSMAYVYLKS
jgi:hypothetical protein